MIENIKVVRVFIASPGGLSGEREAAREVVKEINQAHADHWGCQIKLVGWEDTLPGFQRPQSKINQDLDRCSYFLGVIWNHWGTPPSTSGGGPTSGFEEEYLRALSHLEAGRMADMAVYFKRVEVPQGMQPGPNVRKVLDFRDKCIREKKFLFQDFKDEDEFRSIVRAKIIEIGWRETNVFDKKSQLSSQDEKVPAAHELAEVAPRLIDGEALDFVSAFSQRSADWDATSACEVARFRLIATSLGRFGNDDLHLGNHDANLIFRNRETLPLSVQETRALVDTGVAGFGGQNVPLWYWLKHEGGNKVSFERVAGLISFGTDQEKKNALKILTWAEEPVRPALQNDSYSSVFKSFLSDDAKEPVFSAALEYLERSDDEQDLDILILAAENANEVRARLINAVRASIICKSDPNHALGLIVDSGAEKISNDAIGRLFEKPSILATDALRKAMEAGSEEVRERALGILVNRSEVSFEEAMTWASDSNYNVRVVAIQALEHLGKALAEDEIKNLLVQKSSSGLLGRSSDNDKYLQKYRDLKLRQMGFKELGEAVSQTGVLCHRELKILYARFGSRLREELKMRVQDEHKSFYRDQIESDKDLASASEELRKRFFNMGSAAREQMTDSAFSALSKFGDSDDLEFIRSLIDNGKNQGGFETLEFLAKFGDWSDKSRIIKLEFGLWSLSLLDGGDYHKRNKAKAKALVSVGSDRIVDLLDGDIPSSILRHILLILTKKDFSALPDNVLLEQMNKVDEEYRVACAARAVIDLSQKRLSDLLVKYIETDGYRYYNVIHWLDLGASASRALATRVARAVLRELT